MIHGDNDLTIRLSSLKESSAVTYSKEVDIKKSSEINNKIMEISKTIDKQLKSDGLVNFESLDFIFNNSGKIKIIVHIENEKNEKEYDLESNSKVKTQAQLLITFLSDSNIFSPKETLQTSQTNFINTHHQLFKPQIDESSNSPFKKVTTFFQRLFSFYISMNPVANKMIQESIENQSTEDLKNLYVNPTDLFSRIKGEMLANDPKIADLYTDKELDIFINEKFIEKVNNKFNKKNLPLWDQKVLYQLDVLRVINHIKTHELTTEGYDFLLSISPLDIPLEALASIPITPSNEKALTDIWKHTTGNLFAKGALTNLVNQSNLSGIIIQTEYAQKYLKALEVTPYQISQNLSPFLKDLNDKQPSSLLKDFLIQNIAPVELDINREDSELYLEKKLYNEKIKGPIQEFIHQQTIGTKEVRPLIELLTLQNPEQAEELIEKIEESLTDEEKKIFDTERLQTFLFNKLEQTAVLNYHLTSLQLENLREYREDHIHPAIQIITEEIKENPENLISESLWKLALFLSLNDSLLKEINSGAPLDKGMEKRLRPYIKIKVLMRERNTSQAHLESIEEKITNQEIKAYLKEAPKTYTEKSLDELLLGDDVLNEIEQAEPTSILSNNQQVNLMRLTRLLNKAPELTIEERMQLLNILEKAENDVGLPKVLDKFITKNLEDKEELLNDLPSFLRGIAHTFVAPSLEKEYMIPAGISEPSITFLRSYLYKMNYMRKSEKEITVLNTKLESLLAKYQENPESIKPNERVTLSEIGKISSSGRLNKSINNTPSFFGELEVLGLMEVSPEIERLFDKSKRSQELFSSLEKSVALGVNAHYQNGDILAYVAKKKSEFINKPIPIGERLTSFASNGFLHGAKLFCDNNEVIISHIYEELEQEPLSLYQLCISDIWEIDIAPLVPHSLHAQLKEIYGEEWPKKINEIYQQAESELHTRGGKQFEQVENNQKRRIDAGLANHPTLLKLIGKDVKGHKKEHEKDFTNLHAEFFGDSLPTGNQICSEWASKATLASMLETNKRLVADIKNKVGESYDGNQIIKDLEEKDIEVPLDVKDYLNGTRHWKSERKVTERAERQLVKILKQQGYSKASIELIIRVGNEEIFDLPYSRKERLKAIHPGRMVSLLVDKKCAKQKPPPPEFTSLVAVD